MKGHLLPRLAPRIHRLAGRSPFAEGSALRLGAVLERGNDTGVRCALWPSGDAHCPFPFIRWRGNVFRPRRPVRPWRTGRSGRDASDPPRRGLGTGSRPGVLAHRRPRPFRVATAPAIPAGRPVQRRFEAAEDPLADRLAAGPSGIDDQGRSAVGAGGSHAQSGSPNRDPLPRATRSRSSGFRLGVGAGRTFERRHRARWAGRGNAHAGRPEQRGWGELPGRRPPRDGAPGRGPRGGNALGGRFPADWAGRDRLREIYGHRDRPGSRPPERYGSGENPPGPGLRDGCPVISLLLGLLLNVATRTFLSVSLPMGIAMVAAAARGLLLAPDRISSAGLSEYVHSSAISACTAHRPMLG